MSRSLLNLIILIGVLVCIVCFIFLPHLFTSEYDVTVDENIVSSGKARNTYLVLTTLDTGKKRVFKNINSLIHWKFNSSDVYAELQVPGVYKLKVYGWGIPGFSMYENIIEVVPR